MGQPEKHPPGLYVLFFTEMWERFGFYSMLAMFTLYLRDPNQGFGWSAEQAIHLYANYLMFVYLSPFFGGLIADLGLGYRRSVLIGGLIFMLGYSLLSVHSEPMVYLALTCLVVGNGFFKPNVSAMVGHLYPEGSALKDRAYNIFYMGINIGAFLAPVVAEFTTTWFGFNKAFLVAAGGMVISVAILWAFKRYVEAPRGPALAASPTGPQPVAASPPRKLAIDAVPDLMRIGALLVIFLIVIVFWMVFHQNGSTLTYWANDNTNWKVSGIISNAINPFWVVTLTFPLVWFWGWLAKRGLEPSTPAKMTLGMFLTAASFSLLYVAGKSGEAQEVRSDMYPSGSFRINERVLNSMTADGVPSEVCTKLEVAKDADNKLLIKDKKFSPDERLSQAWATVKQNLKLQGLSEEDWNKIQEIKVKEDVPLDGDKKFSAALTAIVADLKTAGVSDTVLQKIEKYQDYKFTGEEKLLSAVEHVIGPEDTSKYRAVILKQAYLFKVSWLWLVIAYAVVTLGELMLSPMGLSLVSKVAPVYLRGLMMGCWFFATAMGNKLTMIGVYYERWLQSSFFIVLAGMALVMAVVLLLLLKPLKKAMPGV